MQREPSSLPRIRFVITLDADTQMPRDTAGRLVGSLAHPLNRPRFDPSQGRVVAGYGVLQPRISFHLTAATRSRFAAMLATSGGIDPYSTAASDAYMDLFGVGSFTGKGIYDVNAFEEATGDDVPGEPHPQPRPHRGELRAMRPAQRHRAVRRLPGRLPRLRAPRASLGPRRLAAPAVAGRNSGRWSAASGQERRTDRVPRVSTCPSPTEGLPDGRGRTNPLPLLERWKLLDNLRRSLIPPRLLLLLVLGWTVLPGSPWFWTAMAWRSSHCLSSR